MRPGGRLAAAIEVLESVETRYRPVAEALKDWGAAHRFAGSSDRAAIGNLVYDALRWRASTAWVMESDSPRALILGVVAQRWRYGVAGLAEALAGDAHAPQALSDDEVRRLAEADLSGAPDWVRADIPEWLAGAFARAFGSDWVSEGEALALRPPLDLRVNRHKADRAKVLKALQRFAPVETPFSPDGVRIAPIAGDARRHPNVQVEPAFRKGWFEIQDEASQLAALMVGAGPGEQILDLCAGAGGKTLTLSAAMANKGQILATDSDRSRLAPIFERLRRAGTRNVQVRPAGAPLDDLAERMDAVLVDAPCTGSGTWRRRPDAKWRLTQRALDARVAEQAALLAGAAGYVRPGGRLVYVTCSVLPEENEAQIAAFLAARSDMALISPEQAWAAAISTSLPADALVAIDGGEALRLTPARHGSDGFFVAVMQRRSV